MFPHGYIQEENANHSETRGWFIGDFIDKNSPFYDESVEMKWVERKAGELHHGSVSNEPRKTIHIMIDGKGEMIFPSHNTIVPLSGKGAYVVFDTSLCTHEFHAITDCTALTLRFKHG